MSIYRIKPLSDDDRITIKRVINELEKASECFDMSIYDILLGSKPNEHFMFDFTQSAYVNIKIGLKLASYCQTSSNNIYDIITKQIIFLVPTILNIDSILIPTMRELNNSIIDSIVQNLPNFEIIKEVMKQTIGLDKWYKFLIHVFQSESKSRYEKKKLKEYRIRNRERIKQLRNDPINPLDVDIILFTQQLKLNDGYISKISKMLLDDALELVYQNMKRDIFKIDNKVFIRDYLGTESLAIDYLIYEKHKIRKIERCNDRNYIEYLPFSGEIGKSGHLLTRLIEDRCRILCEKYPKLDRFKNRFDGYRTKGYSRRDVSTCLIMDYFDLIWKQYESKIIDEYDAITVIRYRKFVGQAVENYIRTGGVNLYRDYMRGVFKKFESLDFAIHLIRYFKGVE